jgi:hypothetical protein
MKARTLFRLTPVNRPVLGKHRVAMYCRHWRHLWQPISAIRTHIVSGPGSYCISNEQYLKIASAFMLIASSPVVSWYKDNVSTRTELR